jgi:hypothetical protein
MKNHEFSNRFLTDSSDDYLVELWINFCDIAQDLAANIEVQIVGSTQSLVGLVLVKSFRLMLKDTQRQDQLLLLIKCTLEIYVLY